jgi:hypothetical protein
MILRRETYLAGRDLKRDRCLDDLFGRRVRVLEFETFLRRGGIVWDFQGRGR